MKREHKSPSLIQNPVVFGLLGTVGVGLALLGFYMLTNVGPLPLWVTTALFIALGLEPIVAFLVRKGIPRGASVAIIFSALVGAVTAFISLVVPLTNRQLTLFFDQLPGSIADFLRSPAFTSLDAQFNIRGTVEEQVNSFFRSMGGSTEVIQKLLDTWALLVSSVLGVIIVLVLSLYFLASLPAMKSWLYLLVPASRRERFAGLTETITRSVGYYVLGQTTVALLNASFALIVMLIVGVPFPWLLVLAVALLAFVPLVGPVSALTLVSIIALTKGWGTALAFAIAYIIYLQIEAYVISPRIMQRAVSVPGPVVVIAVVAGGSLLGVLGALIAIPVAAAILRILREVYIPYQDTR